MPLQEIFLADILSVDSAKNSQPIDASRNPHVFEINVKSIIFYIGEDPTCGQSANNFMTSSESGVGREQALHFEHAIRQALMPVTPTCSAEGEG